MSENQSKKLVTNTEIENKIRSGMHRYKVEQYLVEQGYSEVEARSRVQQAENFVFAQNAEEQDNRATRQMVIGGVLAVLGLAITFCSYQAASNSPNGGTYYVTWGLVVFGGWQFIRGFMRVDE